MAIVKQISIIDPCLSVQFKRTMSSTVPFMVLADAAGTMAHFHGGGNGLEVCNA
jgi:hypothetical protein